VTSKLKIKLKKVGIIVFIWLMLGFIFGLTDHLTIHSSSSSGPADNYSFSFSMLIHLMAGFLGGILGGSFLVFFVNERYRDKPYLRGIIAVCIGFVVIVALITGIMALVFVPLQTGKSISDPETQALFKVFLTDTIHLKNILIWSLIVGITQLLLHVNDKFGQGLFWDFIRGKYHSPKSETRIFMFVDLKSSTTIAEHLGNAKYYELLRDFYSDITNSIIYNKGEIYQYVGDEVVISWRLKNGIEDNHCMKCYFSMQEKIKKCTDKYMERYGLVPEFKAGLHYGEVIAGEIGIIKRDITYSGDVLNTTARIQSQCNEHNVRILASNELLNLLSLNDYKSTALGAIHLRGKEHEVELSTIEQL
jgi:adenylate cyclase